MSLRERLIAAPTVTRAYRDLADRGVIAPDPAQERVAARLDRLVADIADVPSASKAGALGWLFAKRAARRPPVRGVYIHGGVGGGKTMLMDLFFQCVAEPRKRRVHFNDFMADAHDRINAHRKAVKEGRAKGDDPMPPVARAIALEARVLCFDEFSVTDIADAMILSRLFSALFAEKVTLVATSNVAPEDLYRDGLNRQLFLPFIAVLKEHLDIVPLDGATDYRLAKLRRMPVYLTPLDARAERLMDESWSVIANGAEERDVAIAVMGRKLRAPRAARRAARFSFADLCERPLGARDYLAIAARFDTLFIDRVPVLTEFHRNVVKRFILLIDTVYDRHIRLVVNAAAPPDRLYRGRSGAEAFEFRRTASRLVEMQSRDWLDTTADRPHSSASAEDGAVSRR